MKDHHHLNTKGWVAFRPSQWVAFGLTKTRGPPQQIKWYGQFRLVLIVATLYLVETTMLEPEPSAV